MLDIDSEIFGMADTSDIGEDVEGRLIQVIITYVKKVLNVYSSVCLLAGFHQLTVRSFMNEKMGVGPT